MQDRSPDLSHCLINRGCRLFQHWLVDQWVKVEHHRLLFIRKNQKHIRAEVYQGAVDAMRGDGDAHNVGTRIVLPSSVVSTDRFMAQTYQDAMAIVRRCGKPDLFITFTCNPNWPDIVHNLPAGFTAEDRVDIGNAVFKLKLDALLKELVQVCIPFSGFGGIMKEQTLRGLQLTLSQGFLTDALHAASDPLDFMQDQIMGKVVGKVYVVEWQKRGLPHAHILIILDAPDKPRTSADYDSIAVAEIPDKDAHPRLYKTVTTALMHGPCGQLDQDCPCMEENSAGEHVCSKGFPKPFCEDTRDTSGSYPEYRRRENKDDYKVEYKKRIPANRKRRTAAQDVIMDNRWVVPHNAYLCLRYDAHINSGGCQRHFLRQVPVQVRLQRGRSHRRCVEGKARCAPSTSCCVGVVLRMHGVHVLSQAIFHLLPSRCMCTVVSLRARCQVTCLLAEAEAAAAVAAAVALAAGGEAPAAAPEADDVVDEIKRYVDSRYVTASEAAWRLMQYPIHGEQPSIVRLAVREEGMHGVVFDPTRRDAPEQVAAQQKTTLTGWFAPNHVAKVKHQEACAAALAAGLEPPPPPAQLQMSYHDFPTHFVWSKKKKEWSPRVQYARMPTIGRMYGVFPSTTDQRFYLRLLLINRPGATSWRDLATTGEGTPQEVTHLQLEPPFKPDFKSACRALGLLEEDGEWHNALTEAATHATAASMRELFAVILNFNTVNDPLQLWHQHKEHMTADFLREEQRAPVPADLTPDELVARAEGMQNRSNGRALRALNDLICAWTPHKNIAHYGFPAQILEEQAPGAISCMIAEELEKYDAAVQQLRHDENLILLNPNQRAVYDAVVQCIDTAAEYQSTPTSSSKFAPPVAGAPRNVFFIDGLGGTGKTFVYNTILSHVRAQNKVGLALASSGIAALLLEGGRTAHSRLKIPVGNIDANSTCRIPRVGPLADLIRAAEVIIWDEAPMMERLVYDAVDRTLRDLTGLNLPFGGKVFVLGGDFRQILPVKVKGSRPVIVAACLKFAAVWPHVRQFQLHVNERVRRAHGNDREVKARWAADLVEVGDGTRQTFEGLIRLPDDMVIECRDALDYGPLIDHVYGGVQHLPEAARTEFLINRAILTPRNVDVDAINDAVQAKYGLGDDAPREYKSADSTVDEEAYGDERDEQRGFYPVEYLNTLTPNGLPPHVLKLKVVTTRTIDNYPQTPRQQIE